MSDEDLYLEATNELESDLDIKHFGQNQWQYMMIMK